MGKCLAQTDIADTFNDYFSKVVQNLNIPRKNSILNTGLCINPVLAIVKKYNIIKVSFLSIKNERKCVNLLFILSL